VILSLVQRTQNRGSWLPQSPHEFTRSTHATPCPDRSVRRVFIVAVLEDCGCFAIASTSWVVPWRCCSSVRTTVPCSRGALASCPTARV
jgi:hypothetical protein